MLVRERFGECNRFLFVGVYAVSGRLIWPAHDAILRVIFAKCLQVLSVPGVIQLPHILEIGYSIHNPPRHLFPDNIRFGSDRWFANKAPDSSATELR